MRIRVGIVGLNATWDRRHRPALLALRDRFDVRAVCAEVSAKAEQVAKEFDATVVDGFRMLCEWEDLDAVLMLAPEWYGPLPILAACDAGKAVYCASALDIQPERANEVKQRVEQSGVAFMAEFPRRQAPATLRLKELIATRLGRPKLLFCHERRTQKVHKRPPLTSCLSPLREMMELVDWCRYVVDEEPTSVVGVVHQPANQPTDYQMISLDFSNPENLGQGTLAHVSSGRYLHANWEESEAFRPPADLQVCCENGVAFIDLPNTLVWFDEAGRHRESLDYERPVGEQLLTQFHRAVTSLVRKTSDIEDAYRCLQIALSAQQSWRDGRRISLLD